MGWQRDRASDARIAHVDAVQREQGHARGEGARRHRGLRTVQAARMHRPVEPLAPVVEVARHEHVGFARHLGGEVFGQAILAIGARLDNGVMQELNRQVDQDGEEPRRVAARFLRQKGLA